MPTCQPSAATNLARSRPGGRDCRMAIYYFAYYRKPVRTLDGLAKCSRKRAKIYEAQWCPHCAQQKELFDMPFKKSTTWSSSVIDETTEGGCLHVNQAFIRISELRWDLDWRREMLGTLHSQHRPTQESWSRSVTPAAPRSAECRQLRRVSPGHCRV